MPSWADGPMRRNKSPHFTSSFVLCYHFFLLCSLDISSTALLQPHLQLFYFFTFSFPFLALFLLPHHPTFSSPFSPPSSSFFSSFSQLGFHTFISWLLSLHYAPRSLLLLLSPPPAEFHSLSGSSSLLSYRLHASHGFHSFPLKLTLFLHTLSTTLAHKCCAVSA